RPNDFARTPSNDSPKRTDKGEPGKRAARTGTKPTSGHNLAFFDTGSFARVRPRPTQLNEFTRTTRPNEFARTPSNESPKRTDKGDTAKRGARMCTKPTSGHNLAFFDTGSFARVRPRPTRLNEFTRTSHPNDSARTPSNDSPKRTDKGEPGKQAARTCTKPTSGHNLAFFDTGSFARPTLTSSPNPPAHTSSHAHPQTTHPNERTRESRANELHERAQSQPRVTT